MNDLPPEARAQLMAAEAAIGDAGPGDAAAVGAQDPSKAAAEQKAKQRLQAFKKLVFDRRPSSVLKAWAQPELKPYDPTEDEEKSSGADDAPAGSEGAAAPGGSPKQERASAAGQSSAIGVVGPRPTLSVRRTSSSAPVVVVGAPPPTTP
ncbi:MAG: hypothetical protein VYD05_02420, partial [Planctomycetota bacterium]|nr:hypothetical protein [Planctomycetota bacterium]